MKKQLKPGWLTVTLLATALALLPLIALWVYMRLAWNPTSPRGTVTVLAAASLTEPFQALGEQFEADNPDAKIEFNFSASQALVEQLEGGAVGDVFASASKKYMTQLVDEGKVNEANVKQFICNRLVVIYPADNPAGLQTLQDLAKSGVKLVLVAEDAPAGGYTLEFLDKASQSADFSADYRDTVLANVVSHEDTVKSVVNKVVLGEADAGVVYASDATSTGKGSIGLIEIPDDLNVAAQYPIAVLNETTNPATAGAFVELVMSENGQTTLQKYGFQLCEEK